MKSGEIFRFARKYAARSINHYFALFPRLLASPAHTLSITHFSCSVFLLEDLLIISCFFTSHFYGLIMMGSENKENYPCVYMQKMKERSETERE
jgi:hypothetical protein